MTKRHNPIRLNWSLVELIWFCCSIASVMLMLAIDDVYDPGWWRVLYVPGVVLLAVVMPLAVGYAPSVTRWLWFCVKAWVLRRLGDKSATVDRLYEDRRARLRAKERAEIDRILNTPPRAKPPAAWSPPTAPNPPANAPPTASCGRCPGWLSSPC